VIYDAEHPSGSLYLAALGRVKITLNSPDGCQTIARIVRPEGLFGEFALVGSQAGHESAVALDRVSLMSWTREEVEQQIDREPRLGMALSQYLVRECIEMQDRIESMALCKTPERVLLALGQLAGSQGTLMADGSTRIAALTHQTLADYVGTSREIVTFQLNRLRRAGILRYSRQHIDVSMEAIERELRVHGVRLPDRREAGAQVQAVSRS